MSEATYGVKVGSNVGANVGDNDGDKVSPSDVGLTVGTFVMPSGDLVGLSVTGDLVLGFFVGY